MRNTKIVWSLAALTVMLLGIGVGEYAHLGSTSPQTPLTPTAIRAVSPTVRPASPLPTQSEQTVPPTTAVPQTTQSGANRPAYPGRCLKRRFPSKPYRLRHRFPGPSRLQPAGHRGLPGAPFLSYKPVPPTTPVSTQHASAGRGANPAHTSPPVRTAGRSSIASRGGGPPEVAGAPLQRRQNAAGPTGCTSSRPMTRSGTSPPRLGNPDRWSELFDLNRGRAEPGGSLVDPNLIYRGWTLDFPTHGPNLSPKPAMQPSRETLYVVQPGDTLWDLAATHLGNPDRWSELFDLNRGRANPAANWSARTSSMPDGRSSSRPTPRACCPTRHRRAQSRLKGQDRARLSFQAPLLPGWPT